MRWVTSPYWAATPRSATATSRGPTSSGWPTLNAALGDPEIAADLVHSRRLRNDADSRSARFRRAGRRPKPVIGYSDITAVLNAVTRRTGVVTFHAPMARVAMPPFSRRHFERVLGRAEPAGRLGRLPDPARCPAAP